MKRLFVLSLFLFEAPVQAFINIESVRQQPGTGFLGASSIKITGQRGNTNKLTTTLASLAILRGERDEALLFANDNFGYSNDTRDTNNGQLHLRYTFFDRYKTAYEVFLQTEFDEFKDLNVRNLGGANWRYRLFHESTGSAFLGLGGFYGIENYKHVALRKGVRANLYLSFARKITHLLTSSATIYYQPRISNVGDYHVRAQADLDLNLTEKLLLNLELTLSHDSWVPRPSIVKTDVTYLTGLTLQY